MTCPKCDDRGFIWIQQTPRQAPTVEVCSCQLVKDVVSNVNRGWANLIRAQKIQHSPLLGKEQQDLWVTSQYETFRAHMRYVAVRQGSMWNFRVVSDLDLMTAWLGSTALKRTDIFDPDIAMHGASVSAQMHSLVDLVEPPELLIIQLGVKSARNSATPEVFVEALRHRQFQGKPTWVFDQPDQPFNHNHMCYSEESHRLLASWEHLPLQKSSGELKSESIVVIPSETTQVSVPRTTPRETPREPYREPYRETQHRVEVPTEAVYAIKSAGQKKSKPRRNL